MSRRSGTTGAGCRTSTRSHWEAWRRSAYSHCNDIIGTHLECVFPLCDTRFVLFFDCILGECLPERDAAAAPALSRHPELSGRVVSQRCAPGGASGRGQDPAGPQGGGGGGGQPGGGQRARGKK